MLSGGGDGDPVSASSTNGGGAEAQEAAEYVAELSLQLAGLARRHGFDTLGYILEMARTEALQALRERAPQ